MRFFHLHIKYILFLWLLLPFAKTIGQINNNALSDEITLNAADSGKFGFDLTNLNYLRNTEYFNAIELGRTLFGNQLHPRLTYQPNANTTLQAGVFLQHDFGATPQLSEILPTFSLKIQSKNRKRAFIFGTLEGALSHQLIEPLFDINSAILRRVENGAQFKLNTKNVWLDTWINWERFIERGSPHKEQFTAGFNSHFVLFQNATENTKQLNPNDAELQSGKSGQLLSTILQFTAHHRGGQIDADTSNMVMQLNGAAGFSYQLITPNQHKIRAEAYGVIYQENTNSGFYAYRNGTGFLTHISLEQNGFTINPTYWYGNGFIADRGTTIYQSVSLDKPGHVEKIRQLFFVRFLYAKSLGPNLLLNARFEPYYDLNNRLFEFSYSVYLSYRFNKSITH